MFWRMVKGSLWHQNKKMLLIAFTVALGVSLATAMLNVLLGVGDKVNAELKSYGANINVQPKEASLINDLYAVSDTQAEAGAYLREDELPKVKTIFWSYNIVDYTPYLTTRVSLQSTAENTVKNTANSNNKTVVLNGTWFNRQLALPTGATVETGMMRLKNWWQVEGAWLTDTDTNQVMVGHELATKYNLHLGDKLTIIGDEAKVGAKAKRELEIKGIFTSGDRDDAYLYVPLAVAQEVSANQGRISRIEVSALTTPDNDLARKAAQNPKQLTIKEWEVWYCTAYVSSISYQLQEVLTDAVAKPIRQVAESEGAILDKIQLLMLLITILAMLGSAMGISNLITAGVMDRSAEIGLCKAIGSFNLPIIRTILTETVITGLLGGLIGYFCGLGFAQIIGFTVFGSAIAPSTTVIPLIIVMVVIVVLLGSIPAIRYLLSLDPSDVLHGR